MALACPLCCGERFSDAASLRAHVAAAARRLRCPICTTRFDNLMVMVKHLERGCAGASGAPAEADEQASGIDAEDAHTSFDHTETELQTADEDSEPDETDFSRIAKSELSSSNKNHKATTKSETISEDHCTDENGQVYRRRVVKIANLWSGMGQDKVESADQPILPMVVRPNYPQKNSHVAWKECTLCSKRFRGDNSYRIHMDVVHHGQVHQCTQCDDSFANEPALRKHMTEKHESPYACVYCNRPFESLYQARKHIESHKRRKTSNQYKCELCEEATANPTELKRHYREAHRDVLNPKNVPTMIAPYKLGSLWYQWEGHSYVQRSLSRAGTQLLQCWVDGCWAAVRVPVIGQVSVTGEHLHEPYSWIKERNEMYSSLRRRCSSETTPIRIIYDEECFRYPTAAPHMPFPEATMRKWQRPLKAMSDAMEEMSVGEENVVWSGSKGELLSMLPGSIVVNKVARKRPAEGEE